MRATVIWGSRAIYHQCLELATFLRVIGVHVIDSHFIGIRVLLFLAGYFLLLPSSPFEGIATIEWSTASAADASSDRVAPKRLALPRSKQGLTDDSTLSYTYEEPVDRLYERLTSIQTGLKYYNYWWIYLEGSNVASSRTPLQCPAGYTMVPSTERERQTRGYHKFHCYNLV